MAVMNPTEKKSGETHLCAVYVIVEFLYLGRSGGPGQFTEVRFASLLSGGFTSMAVINQPEKKLANCTSVHLLIMLT